MALVLAATFIVYAGTLSFGFVSDDVYAVGSPFFHSWRYLPRYFSSHVWSYLYPHLLSNYYRPLFLLWLRLNDGFFGASAWGWHFASVLAHLGVTWLVYRLALRVLKDTWAATVSALLFGLHPVHLEAVAYVSGVPEPLSTFFILASFLAYLRERGCDAGWGRAWRVISLALFALSLLAKESGMVLPPLIAASEWLFPRKDGLWDSGGGRIRAALRCLLPYVAVMAIYLFVRAWALKGLAHVVTPLALTTILLTVPFVLAFYIRLLAWPVGLSPYYDTPYVTHPGLRSFVLPLGVVLLAVVVLFAWHRRTRESAKSESRAIAFLGFWIFLPLVSVLNFQLLPAGEIAHDRYLYLPSVGFSLLVALALGRLKIGRKQWLGRPTSQVVATASLMLALGFGTVTQSLYWADELTLDSHAYAVAPGNVAATTSLAAAAAARGMDAAALELYKRALDRRPDFWRANVNLAYLYFKLGNWAEADRYFTRSTTIDPTDGNQFMYLGLTRMEEGRLAEAEAAVRRALEVRPDAPGYQFSLGVILEREGKLEAAGQAFREELVQNPDYPGAADRLAEVEKTLRGSRE